MDDDIWTKEGKIDAIKFIKLMSKLSGEEEREVAKEFLDWLGIKYEDKKTE